MLLRYVLCLLLALGLLTACAGVSASPNLTSSQLNLYGFSEYIPADLIAGFEQATRVKVTYETYSNNEEMLAGLPAKPGYYDMLIPSDYAVEILINQDALRSLDLDLADQPDLIVMGSRGGGGLTGLNLGSVAERVVRRAAVPVLVVK